MKILLTAINSRYTHSNLALLYLYETIYKSNHNTKICEYSINQNVIEILQEIYNESPDVIALSVYIWNKEIIKLLIPELKKVLPKSCIIAGGPEVSYNSSEWISCFPEIDYIIQGAGETAFKKIIDSNLKLDIKIINIQNAHFEEIVFPYKHVDFNNFENKFFYYESSRGCPFKCSYCLSSRSDQKLQFRKTDQVIEELNFLIKQSPETIKFIDRTFNANKKHARFIWEYLISLKTKTIFHFEIHPAFLDKEDFKILEKCPDKRFQFEIGVQSTNPETLKAIDRPYNWQDFSNNIKKLIKLNTINIHLDLIAGLPYEDAEKLKESFDNIYSLQPNHFQLGFLKVLPGTKLSEHTGEYNIKHTNFAPYQVISTKWLTIKEMNSLHNIEHLVDNIYNPHLFNITLKSINLFYSSAFSFYKEFSKFCIEINFDITTKNFKKIIKVLYMFISKLPTTEKQYLTDALRWDWFNYTHNCILPGYLQSQKINNLKESGHLLIKSIVTNQSNNISLKYSALRKIAYFTAESDSFKNDYLKTYSFAIFGPHEITDYFSEFAKENNFIIVRS